MKMGQPPWAKALFRSLEGNTDILRSLRCLLARGSSEVFPVAGVSLPE